MFMVALQLNLKQKERSLREGRFRPRHASHLLRGRTVGLIGYGRIARHVEQRLQGWGVTVQASDPYVAGTLPLDELLRTSDVVSLHVVLTKETRNMIGARELALMKPVRDAGQHLARRRHRRGSAGGGASTPATWPALRWTCFSRSRSTWTTRCLRCDPDRVILTPHSIGHNLRDRSHRRADGVRQHRARAARRAARKRDQPGGDPRLARGGWRCCATESRMRVCSPSRLGHWRSRRDRNWPRRRRRPGSAAPRDEPASSECRKSAAYATSQAVPILLPQRHPLLRMAMTSSRLVVPCATRASMAIGVFIRPGRMALTRTP